MKQKKVVKLTSLKCESLSKKKMFTLQGGKKSTVFGRDSVKFKGGYYCTTDYDEAPDASGSC